MEISALQSNLGALASAAQGQELGAQVVSKTLDMMHQQAGQSQNSGDSSYDFQKFSIRGLWGCRSKNKYRCLA
jgi:hypothetical protein